MTSLFPSFMYLSIVVAFLFLAYLLVRKADYHFLGKQDKELRASLKVTNIVFSLLLGAVILLAINGNNESAYELIFTQELDKVDGSGIESQLSYHIEEEEKETTND